MRRNLPVPGVSWVGLGAASACTCGKSTSGVGNFGYWSFATVLGLWALGSARLNVGLPGGYDSNDATELAGYLPCVYDDPVSHDREHHHGKV